MKRNLKRLILALMISTSCFTATVVWFHLEKGEQHADDREPVARLNESTNDVQRKPLKRVIWESVSKNDSLYGGEAIRTSSNAEAEIVLVKTGTVIHLEADSLVVLEENDRGLSLDFLEGNLYVESADGAKTDDSLTLKAGKGEIKMNAADMSLSRAENGQVNMAVYKGQAELSQGSEKIALNKENSVTMSEQGVSVDKDRIQILSPQPGEPMLLNLNNGEKAQIKFTSLPAGYKVAAEWGPNRHNLQPIGVEGPGDTGSLSFNTKAGRGFLRLTATAEGLPNKTSLVIPFNVDPKSSPTLLEPSAASAIVLDGARKQVQFKWINRHQYESQVFEVATDAQFKNVKQSKSFRNETMAVEMPLEKGNYYWRVTGFLKIGDKSEPLASKGVPFAVQTNREVMPPALLAPADKQHLSYAETQKKGLIFKWQPSPLTKRYAVLVKYRGSNGTRVVLEQDVEGAEAKIAEAVPGVYEWTVGSIDPKDNSEKTSTVATFTIDEMSKVEWAENPPLYHYITPEPSLRAEWKRSEGVTAYRYHVAPEEDAGGEPTWKEVSQNFFEVPVKAEGNYVAIVEALNARGDVLAQSKPKIFTVQRLPLLPAPQWTRGAPEVFKTDAKGNLTFGWEKVEGAEHYLMVLENEEGKVVEQKKITRTTASFSRLKPGQYKVKLKSVDSKQRSSENSSSKELKVPATSDIGVPKIKSMKVK